MSYFVGSTAVFAVPDVVSTAEYYERVLGFSTPWIWREDDVPTFGCVRRDDVEVFLSRRPAATPEGLSHCFSVSDALATYAEHLERGAEIVSPIQDHPWGLREYTLRDLNGYHLRFGGPISSGGGHALSPEYAIEVRPPTSAEYLEIERSANPEIDHAEPADRLTKLNASVVAVHHPTQETVGMALASGDGLNVLYVHNVAVKASHQRQGVGTALMARLMEALRQTAALGTPVLLMTGKAGFYRPHGFRGHAGAMVTDL